MSISLQQRSTQEEIMDDLNCSGKVLNQTLKELEVINRWLGGNNITLEGIRKLVSINPRNPQVLEIADLGCGGGDMLNLVARWARESGVKVKLYGIDANPNVVAYARQNSKQYPEISYETLNIFSETFRRQEFDIILCTLFTHHFDDQQLVSLFQNLYQQARLGVVINDLHRHWFAYWFISVVTRYFSASDMVKNDAPISVARGFRKNDLEKMVGAASIECCRITWRWAFRCQLLFWH